MELFLPRSARIRSQDYSQHIKTFNLSLERPFRLEIHRTALYSSIQPRYPRHPQTRNAYLLSGGDSISEYTAEFRWAVRETLVELLGEDSVTRIERRLPTPPRWTCFRARSASERPALVEAINAQLDADFNLRQSLPARAYIDPRLPPDCISLDYCEAAPLERPVAVVFCDTKAGEALLRGADLYNAGIVGCTATVAKDDLVSVYVDLDSVLRKGQKKFDCIKRKLFIGVGRAAVWREEMASKTGLGVKMLQRVAGEAPAMNGTLTGQVFLQNFPSLLVGHVLDPQPGETVLDACASPGGKTAHLAALMRGQGTLVACDVSVSKAALVACNLRAFAPDMASAFACKSDSSVGPTGQTASLASALLQAERVTLENGVQVLKLEPGGLPLESFDRILVDAPCSALGLRPRLKHDITPEGLEQMAFVQRQILKATIPLLKEGGVLCFSTCSFNPRENESNVRFILDTFGDFDLVEATPKFGGKGVVGFISEQEAAKVQRFDPGDEKGPDCIGFFIAKFVRRRRRV